MNKTDEFWLKSECLGGYLHKFELKQQWAECIQEVCERCGQEEYFQIVDGRIDNLTYIDYHMRQVLVPQHPLFFHEYQYDPYAEQV